MARKLKKVSANSDLVIPTLNRIIPSIEVQKRIVCVRGMTAIIDADIAELYGVETKRVNEAVRNNPDKFPPDYMFELTSSELEDLRSKISTANLSSKSRALPKVFTEKGLYMLATILKSKQAIATTFAIIESFWTESRERHGDAETDLGHARTADFLKGFRDFGQARMRPAGENRRRMA